jgi:hypothetical protein
MAGANIISHMEFLEGYVYLRFTGLPVLRPCLVEDVMLADKRYYI